MQDPKAPIVIIVLFYTIGFLSIIVNNKFIAEIYRGWLWMLYLVALTSFSAGFLVSAFYTFHSRPTLYAKIGQAAFSIIVALALTATTIQIGTSSDLVKAMQSLALLAIIFHLFAEGILAVEGEVGFRQIIR